MPGFVLHQGATVQCLHAGQAVPSAPSARVRLGGLPLAVETSAFQVVGCAFNVSGAPSPCVSVLWTSTATRIMANKMRVLLRDSQASCVPNGTGVLVAASQMRVRGQ